MGLQKILIGALGGGTIDKIADATGVDSKTVGQVVAAGAPLILGQMANNSKSSDEAEKLDKAVEKDHSDSLLDNVTDLFSGGSSESTDGEKILGHVFGKKGEGAADTIAKKFGLDTKTVIKILSFVAPMIMSGIYKQKKSKKLDASGISDMLQSEKAPDGSPLGKIASSFLDKNDDGSMVDDLVGMFLK